jgi:predicted MFS family arabinose efflux permease
MLNFEGASIGGVCCQWFSPGNKPLFLAGKLITGIPLGVFITVAPTYCSEVAPIKLRGVFVEAVNFSIALGQLIGYGVVRQTAMLAGPDSYRILFSVQWGFAAVGLLLAPFLPESPISLIAHGKEESARRSIRRLYGSKFNVESHLTQIITMMQKENSTEKESSGGYARCFEKKNLMRTLVCMSVFFIQANSGVAWVNGYMGYTFELGGMNPAIVFDFTLGITGLMVFGNMCAWFLVDWAGRRRTALFGEFHKLILTFTF